MTASNSELSCELFTECIEQIFEISNNILDGWKLHHNKDIDNGCYITKTSTVTLSKFAEDVDDKILVTFEYHLVYSLSYAVPMLCFVIFKPDGTLLSLEDYWSYNGKLQDSSNMHDTLTQMDHPVLCRPFFTLHPCKTHEIMRPFLANSKNPIISWLSTVAAFVHMELLDDYIKMC